MGSSAKDSLLSEIIDPGEGAPSEAALNRYAEEQAELDRAALEQKLRTQVLRNDTIRLRNEALQVAIKAYGSTQELRQKVSSYFAKAAFGWFGSILIVFALHGFAEKLGGKISERLVLAYVGLSGTVIAFLGGWLVWLFPRNEKSPLEVVLGDISGTTGNSGRSKKKSPAPGTPEL